MTPCARSIRNLRLRAAERRRFSVGVVAGLSYNNPWRSRFRKPLMANSPRLMTVPSQPPGCEVMSNKMIEHSLNAPTFESSFFGNICLSGIFIRGDG